MYIKKIINMNLLILLNDDNSNKFIVARNYIFITDLTFSYLTWDLLR